MTGGRNYAVEVRGQVREVYCIQAESEADARAKFDRGEALTAIITEVTDVETVDVRPWDELPF